MDLNFILTKGHSNSVKDLTNIHTHFWDVFRSTAPSEPPELAHKFTSTEYNYMNRSAHKNGKTYLLRGLKCGLTICSEHLTLLELSDFPELMIFRPSRTKISKILLALDHHILPNHVDITNCYWIFSCSDAIVGWHVWWYRAVTRMLIWKVRVFPWNVTDIVHAQMHCMYHWRL